MSKASVAAKTLAEKTIPSEANLFCDATSNSLQTYFQLVTPELAVTLLEKNHDRNRKVNKMVVDSYARQMIKGLWHPDSGETIKISALGDIIDGQHRLLSIVRANELSDKFRGMEMLMISGIPETAFNSIDDGYKRTLANAFSIRGKNLPNQAALNSALTCLTNLQGCAIFDKHYESIAATRRNSNAEMMDFYEKLPKFRQVAHDFFTKFKHTNIARVMPVGIAFAMYYLYHDVDEEICYSIFKTYETGIPVDDKRELSPTYHVYSRVRRAREMKIRIKPWEHIQMFLWVYTKSLEGKDVHVMPKVFTWKFEGQNLVHVQARKKLRAI